MQDNRNVPIEGLVHIWCYLFRKSNIVNQCSVMLPQDEECTGPWNQMFLKAGYDVSPSFQPLRSSAFNMDNSITVLISLYEEKIKKIKQKVLGFSFIVALIKAL